jgi:PAS domain S-box-containing protein
MRNTPHMSHKDSKNYLKKEFEKIKKTFLHPLIQNVPYGFALISSDFHLLGINDKMREWFPEAHSLCGDRCYRCLYSPDAVTRCPQCPAQLCLEDGAVHAAVIEKRMSSDGVRYFKITCAPVIDPQGSLCGFLEVAEDVSETISLEKKVSDLEVQYNQLIETASDAIIVCTLSGKIILSNKKAHELFGYAADEIIGKQFSQLLTEDTWAAHAIRCSDLSAHQHIVASANNPVLSTCLHRDGSLFSAEITYSFRPMQEGGAVTAFVREISEQKAAAQKLQLYTQQLEQQVHKHIQDLTYFQERLVMFLETANDALISTDEKGTIIYFNKRAEEIFDYTRNEINGKHISLITPQEIWQIAQNAVYTSRNQFANSLGKTLESWGIKKDQTTFPIEFTVSVFDQDHQSFFTLIIRDISRRKKLEQQLQEYATILEEKVKERTFELTQSQQRLNDKVAELSILNQIGEALASTMSLELILDIILVAATSHQGLGFNRAFLFLLNDTATHVEGKVAVGPANAEEAHRIWSEILGQPMNLTEMLYSYVSTKESTDTYVNEMVKRIRIPLSGEENILTHVIKHKQSLNIVNGATHPLVPPDLLGTIQCSSFAVVPLVAREKVLGVLWADNAITQKPIEDRDVEQLRIFSNNASLAIENSNLYQSIQEKVTELDRAYQELQENRDRLVRSEKLAAVGEMSATVAHAIRNPLTAIGGFARRLLKREAVSENTNKYLKIIIDEIDRLEVLLTEMLDFVRPKEPNIQNIYIHDILEHTLEILADELKSRNIATQKNYLPDVPKARIDSDQLEEVFLNMFRNAIDAMPEGGMLSICTCRESDCIKISVADTGAGIPESDAEKIFHPFFTRKPKGSGLGLAVCNQIISWHGGHIDLRKDSPVGAVFDIFLPIL